MQIYLKLWVDLMDGRLMNPVTHSPNCSSRFHWKVLHWSCTFLLYPAHFDLLRIENFNISLHQLTLTLKVKCNLNVLIFLLHQCSSAQNCSCSCRLMHEVCRSWVSAENIKTLLECVLVPCEDDSVSIRIICLDEIMPIDFAATCFSFYLSST